MPPRDERKVTPIHHRDLSRSELEAAVGAPIESDPDSSERPWPVLDPAALSGLAGRVVHAATRNSEADPAAVLMTFLVSFCALVDNTTRVRVGETSHPPRVWALIVGATSRARKGTSGEPVKRLIRRVEKELQRDVLGYAPLRVVGGPLSTGEGVIHQVRDASEKPSRKGDPLIADDGIGDKRLLVTEGEFGGVLSCMQREGNTLSSTLRDAWDVAERWHVLRPMVKHNPIAATNPHICIVGHITRFELLALVSPADLYNGLANRLLWACARRARLVPMPEPMDGAAVNELGGMIAARVKSVHRAGNRVMRCSEAFRARWCELYGALTLDRPGIHGAVTARAEAQVLRLALIYALLDGAPEIDAEHLASAEALWRYCDQSARYLFDERDPDSIGPRVPAT